MNKHLWELGKYSSLFMASRVDESISMLRMRMWAEVVGVRYPCTLR